MIQSLSAEELRELRKLMPKIKLLAQNKERIEAILEHLADERDAARKIVEEYAKIDGTVDRIEEILPILEHLVENKERIDWFWKASRRYGGAAIGLVILASAFQESAVKLLMWVKTWFVVR